MLQTHEGRNPSDPTSLVVWSLPCSSTCRSKTSMVLTLGLRSLGYFLHTACVTRSQQWLKHSNDKKMMQQFRVFVWNKEAFCLTCRCYLRLSRILPLRTCDEPKQHLCERIQHSYFDTSLNRNTFASNQQALQSVAQWVIFLGLNKLEMPELLFLRPWHS